MEQRATEPRLILGGQANGEIIAISSGKTNSNGVTSLDELGSGSSVAFNHLHHIPIALRPIHTNAVIVRGEPLLIEFPS